MTKRLDEVIEKLRRLPSGRQNEAAELLENLVEQDPDSFRLTPEQVAEVGRRLAMPKSHASHEEVHAFFCKRTG